MELIRGLHNIQPRHRGCVLTIGNFDGVHLGHQAVLHKVVAIAKQMQLPSCVMLFEPQPLELFAGTAAPARLTRFREKYNALAQLGIDRLLCVNFTPAFAAQAPQQFIQQLLLKQLGVEHLIVGDDFRFGSNRSGNFELLALASEQYQFSLCSTSSLVLGQQRISSTLIRQALADDNLTLAADMLGRPFALTGRVRHGRKLGRDLGFPTANVFLYRRKLPVAGVYAITANTVFGSYYGVANIGNRPTVQGQRQQLEAHLFDFKGDLYGSQIEVLLQHKLRNEQRFDGLAALQHQIAADVTAAKAFFQRAALTQAHATTDKTEHNG
ncbi:bifunctional riboflavin kinase/FAD synthetase [Rheinheimera sp. YQF-2]|jgi:riboflavin kinase/FMN adenylyltransferase|uniref:Riboflavin biosynthesis protein n=1 Tax=Rheinheimera lutimaris TaxID=2740584 RepID=A0A7Y5AMQ9_9GAMM|nr:bifunctional riboflavin kinase/FAD synthetase [Rheinheimera lutimaris]NRQ41247.1 bifunctional riboflavin kinase/FAD synthetase [Rheinheimera lutimaris]